MAGLIKELCATKSCGIVLDIGAGLVGKHIEYVTAWHLRLW